MIWIILPLTRETTGGQFRPKLSLRHLCDCSEVRHWTHDEICVFFCHASTKTYCSLNRLLCDLKHAMIYMCLHILSLNVDFPDLLELLKLLKWSVRNYLNNKFLLLEHIHVHDTFWASSVFYVCDVHSPTVGMWIINSQFMPIFRNCEVPERKKITFLYVVSIKACLFAKISFTRNENISASTFFAVHWSHTLFRWMWNLRFSVGNRILCRSDFRFSVAECGTSDSL